MYCKQEMWPPPPSCCALFALPLVASAAWRCPLSACCMLSMHPTREHAFQCCCASPDLPVTWGQAGSQSVHRPAPL